MNYIEQPFAKKYITFFSELSIMILYTHNLLSYLLLTSKFTKFTNFFLSSKFPSRNEKTPIQLKLGSTGFWPLKMLKGSGSMQNFRTKISHNILREYLPKDFCKNAFFAINLVSITNFFFLGSGKYYMYLLLVLRLSGVADSGTNPLNTWIFN